MRWRSGVDSVMAAGFLSVIAFSHLFTLMQLFASLLMVPVATTLAEAYSSHTWDSLVIYGVAGVLLIAIVSYYRDFSGVMKGSLVMLFDGLGDLHKILNPESQSPDVATAPHRRCP